MSRPGRNDPCPCGSGKKYKKCHWNEDQRAAAERAALDQVKRERLESLGSPTSKELRTMAEEMSGRTLPAGPLPAGTVESLTEIWREDRLAQVAREEVDEPRWAEYFESHPEEFDRIARRLATDDRLGKYELTPHNVRTVRTELGPLPEAAEALPDYAARAVDLVLEEDDRQMYSRAILALVPDLVDAGLERDAYVAARSSDDVLDPGAPFSPFLEQVVQRSLSPEEE